MLGSWAPAGNPLIHVDNYSGRDYLLIRRLDYNYTLFHRHRISCMAFSELYDSSWKTIISPFVAKHKPSALGPPTQRLHSHTIERQTIELPSSRGSLLNGFVSSCPENGRSDLVLYLHGSGGSKLDALNLIPCIPKYRLAVAAFDFAGCGNSEKQYLTYGRYEVEDARLFLQEVRRRLNVGKVTIWGRSMGAVTAIMFAHKYPDLIDGLVLDGPFKRLEQVVSRAA